MKTLKNTGITLMFAIVASTAALAQSPNQMLAHAGPVRQSETTYQPQAARTEIFGISLYRVQKSMKMRLSVQKKAGERATVKLLDERGHVLHEKSVNRLTQKYGCNFDFTNVKDGRYIIEVVNDGEVIRREVKLSSAEVVETPTRMLVALN